MRGDDEVREDDLQNYPMYNASVQRTRVDVNAWINTDRGRPELRLSDADGNQSDITP